VGGEGGEGGEGGVGEVRQIWIGLVQVAPLPGHDVFDGNAGAFVNAVALASSVADYQSAVSVPLSDLHLFAIEFENVEPLATRIRERGPLDDDLMALAVEGRRMNAACFHNFHTYPHADA